MPKMKAKKAGKIKKGKSTERTRERMRTGTKEDDVYSDEGREELLDDDEITPEEEGFMKGYDISDKFSKCARCQKSLYDDNFVEKEISGEFFKFCCKECAARFEPEIE